MLYVVCGTNISIRWYVLVYINFIIHFFHWITWSSILCIYRYAKRILAWWKRKEQTEEDVFTRWEKDFELPLLSSNGLFEEYLELGLYVAINHMHCWIVHTVNVINYIISHIQVLHKTQNYLKLKAIYIYVNHDRLGLWSCSPSWFLSVP